MCVPKPPEQAKGKLCGREMQARRSGPACPGERDAADDDAIRIARAGGEDFCFPRAGGPIG